jgi:glycosyltransferase involved in cell wall biosynthesis
MRTELVSLRMPEPVVIPVAVDGAHFRPPSRDERDRARAEFGVGPEFTVLYAGHLRALKRVDALITAFSGLSPDTPARLVLVGGSRGAADDVEPSLREQVQRLGIASSVMFAGVLDDPRPAYWAADAFVLPSSREGMPNTLLEALACGVACVAPPSAGGDEILGRGVGLVPPTNEPADLLAALRTVADDETRGGELRRRGPEHVAAFDVETVTDAYERVLGELAPVLAR